MCIPYSTRARPLLNRSALDGKKIAAAAAAVSVPSRKSAHASPHSYSEKRRDARLPDRVVGARSRQLVFFGTIKPALKTKGVAVAASQDSQPGVSFAELSAFRFLLFLLFFRGSLLVFWRVSFLFFPYFFFYV
jgi:hypothetical protein